jgi:hypothetical protein
LEGVFFATSSPAPKKSLLETSVTSAVSQSCTSTLVRKCCSMKMLMICAHSNTRVLRYKSLHAIVLSFAGTEGPNGDGLFTSASLGQENTESSLKKLTFKSFSFPTVLVSGRARSRRARCVRVCRGDEEDDGHLAFSWIRHRVENSKQPFLFSNF